MGDREHSTARADDRGRPIGARRWALALSALAVVLAAGPALARQQPESVEPGSASSQQLPAPKRALLSLTVNEVARGDALVVIRPPDVLVPVDLLAALGLGGLAGRREIIDGQPHVSLASLVPDVAFVLDERGLALRITVRPALLGAREFRLRTGAPRGMEFTRSASGFVNYAVNWTERVGYDAAGEAGLTIGGGLALTTMSWREGGRAVRGLTSYTVDDRDRLRRWTVGDAYRPASLIGSGGYAAGVRVARDFSLDPYFIQFPTATLSGEVVTPSTAEVYVNGRLVSRQTLDPGQFRMSDLPLSTGRNDTRVVIRDAFGRSREVSAAYYVTTAALAKGLHDYDYSAGFTRRSFGASSLDYGSFAAVAQHRYGLTESLTAGGRVEASGGVFSGGPMFNLRLPAGQLETAASFSRAHARSGAALAAGYQYVGVPVGFGLSARAFTSSFRSIDSTAADRPRLEMNVYAGTLIASRVSVTLQQSYRDLRAQGVTARTALVASTRLFGRATAVATAALDRRSGVSGRSFSAGVTMPVGGRATASAGVERQQGRTGVATEVHQPLPVGPGYGYRLRMSGTDGPVNRIGSGAFQYQSQFGRVELSDDLLDGFQSRRVSVSGSLVGIGGSIVPSRPVDSSYALVRVPGAAHVRAFANNQPIGRTNRRGEIFVPDLLPYYGNRLSIADQDVPLDYSVAEIERTVAPPYRGGSLVVFRAAKVQPVTGAIVLAVEDQELIPAFGEMTLVTPLGEATSPLGRGGEFYFENVPAGRHVASVRFRDLACTLTVTMPASAETIVRLGLLRCAAGKERP